MIIAGERVTGLTRREAALHVPRQMLSLGVYGSEMFFEVHIARDHFQGTKLLRRGPPPLVVLVQGIPQSNPTCARGWICRLPSAERSIYRKV